MELRVVRVTDRFDDACHLYGAVLGWRVTREWTEGGRGRIFGYGDVGRVELIESVEAVSPVTGVFLSIETEDVDDLYARVVRAGVQVSEGVTQRPWGHRNFSVVDPSGLSLVFFEWI